MSDLKKLATPCGFNTATNRVVLGQFVYGLRDHAVQAKPIERFATISATDALTAVQSAEQSRIDSAAVRGENMSSCGPAHSTEAPPNGPANGENAPQANDEVHRLDKRNNFLPESSRKTQLRCYRCGEGHHSRNCPKDWRNFFCERCQRYGHLRVVCKSKNVTPRAGPSSRHPGQSPSGNTNHVSLPVEYPENLFNIGSNDILSDEVVMQPIIVQVSINGKNVPFEVDSGAGRSLICLQTFNSLFTPDTQPEINDSNVVLSTWGATATLKIVGRFEAQITHKGLRKTLPVLVTKKNGPNSWGEIGFNPS